LRLLPASNAGLTFLCLYHRSLLQVAGDQLLRQDDRLLDAPRCR
jgi:hypothetical protein